MTTSVVGEEPRDAVLLEEFEPVVQAGDEGGLREDLGDPPLGRDGRHGGETARDRPARRGVDDVMRGLAVGEPRALGAARRGDSAVVDKNGVEWCFGERIEDPDGP